MLQWIAANLGSILICTALLGIIIGILRYLIRQKKRGGSSCGCGCAHCSLNGACHSDKR